MKNLSFISRIYRKALAAARRSTSFSTPYFTDGQTARRRRREARRREDLDAARRRAARAAELY